MALRPYAATLPRHYQARSAVVTRRTEQAFARVLARVGKFSISDATLQVRFLPDAIEPLCTQADVCGIT